MKRMIAWACASATALSAAHAGDTYIQLHAGVFQQTADTVEAQDDVFNVSVDFDAEADPGFALGGAIGRYIFPAVAVEGEITYRNANIDTISGGGFETSVDDNLETVALMLNGVVRPSFPLLPQPYVGVGVGYVTSNIEDEDGDNVGGEFAYQVKAGVSFDVLPTPGRIGVEVSYLQTSDFNAEGDSVDIDWSYGGVTGMVTYFKRF
ncbi:MAG: outer membrane beta-barrel protein [Pseudomonadota bacterium]